MTHISRNANGVEVPVQIRQVHAARERWICSCKSLRVVSSGLLRVFWKEFFIYLCLEDKPPKFRGSLYFLVCASSVWPRSPSCYSSVSNTEVALRSHLPFKQARLRSRVSPRGATHGGALFYAQCAHCNSQVLW